MFAKAWVPTKSPLGSVRREANIRLDRAIWTIRRSEREMACEAELFLKDSEWEGGGGAADKSREARMGAGRWVTITS